MFDTVEEIHGAGTGITNGKKHKEKGIKMSRTTRNHINYNTGKQEIIRDNKPRCQCCCNPRHSAYGNKKEKLTIQERKEDKF